MDSKQTDTKSVGSKESINRRKVHYEDRGTGKTLVLLHGWGFDHTSWIPVMDRLTHRYRLIAVDIRGHGRSQKSTLPYTMQDLSNDLFEFISGLSLNEPPILVGHSLGGMVVQQLAVDHPEVAEKLIVLDSDLNGPAAVRHFMMAIAHLSAGIMRATGSWMGIKRSMRLYQKVLSQVAYSKAWRKENRGLLKEAAAQFEKNSERELVWSLLAYASRPDLSQDLQKLSCPTLLVRGSKDLIMTQSKMEALSLAIPKPRLLVIPGAGHMVVVEQPDSIASVIDSFVQE